MTDERLEEIRKRNKNGRGTHPEDELLTYVDALRKERDDARQLADQITRRKIDWSKMDETAFNEIERQRDSALARIEKLRGSLLEAKHAHMLHLEEKDYGKSVTLIVNEAIRADDAAAKGE
jgi:hypothetical protein